MVFNGGTLDASGTNYLAGTMGMGTGTGTILMGPSLQFLDSSTNVWGSGTVNLVGTLGPTTMRFGTDRYALTGDQKSKLFYTGRHVALDDQGYVVLAAGMMIIVQ